MDPADFVQELFDGLDREIQSGVQEVQDWIEAETEVRQRIGNGGRQ